MRGVRLEAVRQVETGVGEANRIVHHLILVRARPAVGMVIYRSTSDVVEISVDGNAGLPRAKASKASLRHLQR